MAFELTRSMSSVQRYRSLAQGGPLNSQSRFHCGQWTPRLEASPMAGVGGTADIARTRPAVWMAQ